MEERKLFTDWEERFNCLARDATPEQLASQLTEAEFREIAFRDGRIPCGVNHTTRKQFLAENGHALTRENMADSSLSHVQNGRSQ